MEKQKWTKIRELFNDAAGLEGREREKYLNENCGNPNIRKEVESLLDSYHDAGGFLETSSTLITGNNREKIDPRSGVMTGKEVGHYRIVKKIGEGGMAVVYLATRNDLQFNISVAVKFIKRGMDTDEIIRRFKFEQQTLADLSHPYISRILDGGTTENGLPYFVMELVEGIPINEYCKKHDLSIKDRLNLFLKVCEAVNFAHKNLIVHRDIKPGNIFVTEDGVPKLLDFGIAKLLDATDEHFTRTGVRLMTLDYASPEQFTGKTITTATDIYSLGVILYELVTGESPYHFKDNFPGEKEKVICSVDPAKPSLVLKKKLSEAAKNKSSYFERTYDSGLSGDLDNIILKSLSKEPERRYSSVEQFADDIKRSMRGLPILAHKDSIAYRTSKFVRRHKAGVFFTAVLFAIMVAGIAGIIYQSNIANRNRITAEIEAKKAERIYSFLQNILVSADPSRDGSEVKVVDLLDNADDEIESELKDEPEIQAELRKTIGITYQGLGLYDKAIKELTKAVELRNKFEGKITEKAGAVKDLAVAYHYNGDYENAEKFYRESLQLHETVPENRTQRFAESLNDYGTLKMDIEELDSALFYFKKALPVYNEVYGNYPSPDIASVLNNIGLAYQSGNNLDSAEYYLTKSLEMNENINPDNYNLIYNYNNLAFVFYGRNDINKARELFGKSLSLRKKYLNPGHPELALAIYNFGCITFYSGDYGSSVELINEALGIWQKTLEEDHPYFGNSYYWLGKNYNKLGMADSAEALLHNAIKIREATHGENKNLVAVTKIELGYTYLLQNRSKEAESIILDNMEVLRETYGEDAKEIVYAKKLLNEIKEKQPGGKKI